VTERCAHRYSTKLCRQPASVDGYCATHDLERRRAFALVAIVCTDDDNFTIARRHNLPVGAVAQLRAEFRNTGLHRH
jgi:hypothetical protein